MIYVVTSLYLLAKFYLAVSIHTTRERLGVDHMRVWCTHVNVDRPRNRDGVVRRHWLPLDQRCQVDVSPKVCQNLQRRQDGEPALVVTITHSRRGGDGGV